MIFNIVLYLFALSGLCFAIYHTIEVIKLKVMIRKKQNERVKEFDKMCEQTLETLNKFKIPKKLLH